MKNVAKGKKEERKKGPEEIHLKVSRSCLWGPPLSSEGGRGPLGKREGGEERRKWGSEKVQIGEKKGNDLDQYLYSAVWSN